LIGSHDVTAALKAGEVVVIGGSGVLQIHGTHHKLRLRDGNYGILNSICSSQA
jgi:hypothetical protein